MEYMKRCLGVLAEKGIETQLVSLRDKNIKPCLGCYACVKKKACAQDDDDFADLLALMEEADGIVLGSPVYLSSVVPQMMCLLSRATFVAHWNDKFLAGKVGGPITVARRAGHNLAFSQLLLWFFINGITVPGSTYWTVGTAGAGGAHDADKDEEGMTHVANFAANMAAVMKKLLA
ncbi:MAG: flavodoxin family protein [Desulfovibrio sp.]|nr:flavodoxin family protein [Desulfovibrio sp.]